MPIQVPVWRQVQRENFTDWEQLANFLELDQASKSEIIVSRKFPLNLPLRLAQKIMRNDLKDPILKQFLPVKAEQIVSNGFIDDPVQDAFFRKSGRLLHKYHGRALLTVTGACAMHCRYCFRKNFDYQDKAPTYSEELHYLAHDPSISEIILSGGDPLSLSDERLAHLLQELEAIPHLTRLRFHTRFPIGIPERIDDSFLELLSTSRLQIWFVIHCNHPKELDQEVLASLKRIQRLGIPVLSQAVLLQGVNDQVDILKQLCEKLANHGILPYYLHQLDRVQGSAHFEVSEEVGKTLIQKLKAELSGYAVPKYVRETAGEPHKSPIEI